MIGKVIMDIHMKLKDKKTFLLGGALLLFLLLFAMMSSVAAADNLPEDGNMTYDEINKNYPHDPNNPDEHVVLRLKKVLDFCHKKEILNLNVEGNEYKY